MAYMDKKAILTKAFNEIDADKNGFIDAYEVETVLKNYHKEQGITLDYETMKNRVLTFMQRLDTNNDKQISLEEFIDYFLNHIPSPTDTDEL